MSRVLIVEDDALIGMLLEQILEANGHDVCAIAMTESEAVDAAIQHRPDLMIVDGHLTHGSGIDAVEQVLEHWPLPHVFVSGDPNGIRARRPDAVVVRKPFREAELVGAIAAALQSGPSDA